MMMLRQVVGCWCSSSSLVAASVASGGVDGYLRRGRIHKRFAVTRSNDSGIVRDSMEDVFGGFNNNLVSFLPNRVVFSLSGKDATTFLQGVTTNNISEIENEPIMYTMLLSGKGRTVCDAFVVKKETGTVENPSYLIDIDKELSDTIRKYIKWYKLRSKIVLQEEPNYEVVATINSNIVFSGWKGGKDPRIAALDEGRLSRFIVDKSQKDNERSNDDVTVDYMGEEYKRLRIKLGLGEGDMDHPSGKAIPLHCNLDWLHGVSWSKGCYIGQELTARSHHQGVVRRRIMPISFQSNDFIESGAEVRSASDDKEIGTILSKFDEGALALMRLSNVFRHKDASFYVHCNGHAIPCQIHEPFWWKQHSQ
eukprot:m.32771 g.32771  ORF g.32771 m.32771 type:complete len:365 (-) comp6408_c0_seq2:1731-2825(-)